MLYFRSDEAMKLSVSLLSKAFYKVITGKYRDKVFTVEVKLRAYEIIAISDILQHTLELLSKISGSEEGLLEVRSMS